LCFSFTPEEEQKILSLRQKTVSFAKIAKEINRPKSSVYKHFKKLQNENSLNE